MSGVGTAFGFGFGLGNNRVVATAPLIRPSKMVVFDGLTKFFDLGTLRINDIIQGTGQKFTIAGLFKLRAVGGDSPVFLCSEKVAEFQMRIIWDDPSGWLDFQFSTNGGASYNASYKPAAPLDIQGGWYTWAITYDGSLADHRAKLYFNGIEIAQADPLNEGTIHSIPDAVIRNSITDTPVLPMNGNVAWFGWWNKVKNSSEILSWNPSPGVFKIPINDPDAVKIFDAGQLSDLTTGWKDQDGNNFGAFNNAEAGDLQAFA